MEMVEITCYGCGTKASKYKKEIDRQLERGKTRFYCSKRCCNQFAPRVKIHTEVVKNCPVCSEAFKTTTHKRAAKTCSIGCATKHGQSLLTDEKKRIRAEKLRAANLGRIRNPKLKGDRQNSGIYKHTIYNLTPLCEICGKTFEQKTRSPKPRKTCSKECFIKHCSIRSKANPNCGGETNYKRFYYNDILMDSSWEVELAKWLDEKQIKWVRSRKLMFYWQDSEGLKRRYYPDFYLPDFNIYLDPKNKYLQERDKNKLDSVRELNKITLLSGDLDLIKGALTNERAMGNK